MSHKKECFHARIAAGMRIWDLKNPEPNENFDEDEWIEWYKKRAGIEEKGIAKVAGELGIPAMSSRDIPCTCDSI